MLRSCAQSGFSLDQDFLTHCELHKIIFMKIFHERIDTVEFLFKWFVSTFILCSLQPYATKLSFRFILK